MVNFKLRVPGYAQKTGRRIFLQPSVFEHGRKAQFSSATRKHSIYFHYPWSQQDDLEIELPAGYTLDNSDKPAPFNAENISGYKVSIGVTNDERFLIVRREFFFGRGGNLIFTPDRYQPLKALFDRLQTSDSHTITLKSTGN
jgi:hypothetical protein